MNDPRPGQHFASDEPPPASNDPRPAQAFDPATASRDWQPEAQPEAPGEAALVAGLARPRRRRFR